MGYDPLTSPLYLGFTPAGLLVSGVLGDTATVDCPTSTCPCLLLTAGHAHGVQGPVIQRCEGTTGGVERDGRAGQLVRCQSNCFRPCTCAQLNTMAASDQCTCMWSTGGGFVACVPRRWVRAAGRGRRARAVLICATVRPVQGMCMALNKRLVTLAMHL